eukprot:363411-Chlamydomonas_euryale.AAC.14
MRGGGATGRPRTHCGTRRQLTATGAFAARLAATACPAAAAAAAASAVVVSVAASAQLARVPRCQQAGQQQRRRAVDLTPAEARHTLPRDRMQLRPKHQQHGGRAGRSTR